MFTKLGINDFLNNRFMNLIILLFMTLAVFLLSIAFILSTNLLESSREFIDQASVPDIIQMHLGDIDRDAISQFVQEEPAISDYQIVEFANMDNSMIINGDKTLANDLQDNGLVVQGTTFDYLLDMNNDKISPQIGEIYLPLYLLVNKFAELGDTIEISGKSFRVAGFLRDAQMNSTLSSSKRWLIHPQDFKEMVDLMHLEYIIEFQLTEPKDIGKIEAAYIQTGLPANGPMITLPLINLINLISDGIIIALLVFMSILMIIVFYIILRLTILAKIEEDYKEIAVLKAIGFKNHKIKNLYLAKYMIMLTISLILGYLCALVLENRFMENIQLYMGNVENTYSWLTGGVGALLTVLICYLLIKHLLRKVHKVSVRDAVTSFSIQTQSSHSLLSLQNNCIGRNMVLAINDIFDRKYQYLQIIIIIVILSFLAILPINLSSTVRDPTFSHYMGVGDFDFALNREAWQEENEEFKSVISALQNDSRVDKLIKYNTYNADVYLSEANQANMKIEIGDHNQFNFRYLEGREAQARNELTMSYLLVQELQVAIGDKLKIKIDNQMKELELTGIYSDITNGGKTAKANFPISNQQPIWTNYRIKVKENEKVQELVSQYRKQFPNLTFQDISEYMDQIYGNISSIVAKSSYYTIAVVMILTCLILALFIKLLYLKDCPVFAMTLAFGFKKKDIIEQLFYRVLIIVFIGVVLGTFLVNSFGQLLVSSFFKGLGAPSFSFKNNPILTIGIIPSLILLMALIGGFLGIGRINPKHLIMYIKE